VEINTLEILLDSIAFIAVSYLGILVYSKNKQSWTNRFFVLLALVLDIYIVVNYLSLHPPIATPENQLFWIRVVMFVASFIGPMLFMLVHTFPENTVRLTKKYFIPLAILASASMIASITPLVFKSLEFIDGEPVPTPGPGMPIFVLNFVGLILLSFAVLIRKYKNAGGINKTKYLYLLLGVFISFTLMGIFTVVMVVIFKTSSGVVMGPVFPIILIALLYYAIIKHNLFNIRLLATETFTLIIVLIFLINVLTSSSFSEFIFNIILFTSIIIFGFFLIRGTVREIRELERLSRAKSDFVSIVSHQLRTPLTAIKGFVSMIKEGSGSEDDRRDWLNKTYIANERMIRLVSNILNISRIERGKLQYNFRDTNIPDVIEGVISEARMQAERKGIVLNWEKPTMDVPLIRADEEKLHQVIQNLVDNAIHYTDKGHINVRLTYLPALNRVKITVQDTGIGMAKEDLANLFVQFSRGDGGQKANVEGLGLGLYVAQSIVKAHNGKIWAESEGLHKGSRFYVELPVQ